MKKLSLAAAAVALFATSTFAAPHADIMVPMKDANGADAGYIVIKDVRNGLLVEARMENIPEGWHGFHIHEVGSCDDAFKAAKGHYNPDGTMHVMNKDKQLYGGDLPNVYAAADGSVRADILAQIVTLDDGPTTLLDADGSSFVVHAKADSYETDARAGGRIACGIIDAGK